MTRIAALVALVLALIAAPAANAAAGDVASWNYDLTGSRNNPSETTITPKNVSKLKLKWAFAVPHAIGQESQPAVVGSTLYVGGTNGVFYALDAKTGKLLWRFDTRRVQAPGLKGNQLRDGPAVANGIVYFGDKKANVYALEAKTGRLLWHRKVDDFPYAVMTSSPVIFRGRLIVGVSSIEEVIAAEPTYPCCSFRGSLVALNAKTGALLWKHFLLPNPPTQTGFNNPPFNTTPTFGPSGDSVWSTPAIDASTNTVYVGTGNNYTGTSSQEDAIAAFNVANGRQKWLTQLNKADTWNFACIGTPVLPNCPTPGSDFDFGASPNLFKIGKRTVVGVGQKSGMYHVLDAKTGKIVWQDSLSHASGLPEAGGLEGIEWGSSYDGKRLYAATDIGNPGTLFALAPVNGHMIWSHPVPLTTCFHGGAARYIHLTPIECLPALPAAVSSTPGLVWEGGSDGKLHAYASATGRILWSFDTVRTYLPGHTTDHVLGHGGSIDHGGTVVSHGMVYSASGFTHFGIIGSEMAGNMVLAFGLP